MILPSASSFQKQTNINTIPTNEHSNATTSETGRASISPQRNEDSNSVVDNSAIVYESERDNQLMSKQQTQHQGRVPSARSQPSNNGNISKEQIPVNRKDN
jgi:hypothetical protein